MQGILDYLKEEWIQAHNNDRSMKLEANEPWRLEPLPHVPQQPNDLDCGVYVCSYPGRYLFRDDILPVGKEECFVQRNFIAFAVLTACSKPKEDWPTYFREMFLKRIEKEANKRAEAKAADKRRAKAAAAAAAAAALAGASPTFTT